MKSWFKQFSDELWLRPDDSGADEAAFVRKVLKLRKGQKVLDAPCGAGRIAIHLAKAGCMVAGIDQSEAFINRVVKRFKKEKQQGIFFPMDLRAMTFSNEFHGIYNWFGSFGYFSDQENERVLQKYAAALRKGGRLLIDQPNRESLLRNFGAMLSIRGFTVKNQWNLKTQRINSDWVIKRNGKIQHNKMSMRLYTQGQMKKLFEKNGLTVEKVYGSMEGDVYKRSSSRLIMVGQKYKENS